MAHLGALWVGSCRASYEEASGSCRFEKGPMIPPQTIATLTAELKILQAEQEQMMALAVYVGMSKEEAARYDKQRRRITEIGAALSGSERGFSVALICPRTLFPTKKSNVSEVSKAKPRLFIRKTRRRHGKRSMWHGRIGSQPSPTWDKAVTYQGPDRSPAIRVANFLSLHC